MAKAPDDAKCLAERSVEMCPGSAVVRWRRSVMKYGYDGFRTDEQGAAAVNLPRKGATQREECAQRQKANSQPRPLRGP
jgi:hypothetical protein